MNPIAKQVPAQFVAGDTVSFSVTLGDYSPATYTLRFRFVGAQYKTDVDAVADGASFTVTLDGEATKAFVPGRYNWAAAAILIGSSPEIRKTLEAGGLEVLADAFNVTAPTDQRSWARRTLEAIEAMLEGKASLDQQSYTIGDRSLSRFSPAELLKWRDQLRREVKQEDDAAAAERGEPTGGKLRGRFSNA